MTSDADDPLSWAGDDDQSERVRATGSDRAPSLPSGWKAVGKDSESVRSDADAADVLAGADALEDGDDSSAAPPLSTPMLLLVGIVGGVYLLYTIGWIIGGVNLQASALFLVPSVMYDVGRWAAVLAPALWFGAVWILTRRSPSWVRVLGLLAGVALLVPWPFVMTGAVGA